MGEGVRLSNDFTIENQHNQQSNQPQHPNKQIKLKIYLKKHQLVII